MADVRPPWRIPLLILGFASLIIGVGAGLLRLGWAVLPDHMGGPRPVKRQRGDGLAIGEQLVRRTLVAVARAGAPADPRTELFLSSIQS